MYVSVDVSLTPRQKAGRLPVFVFFCSQSWRIWDHHLRQPSRKPTVGSAGSRKNDGMPGVGPRRQETAILPLASRDGTVRIAFAGLH